jgi:hypothetical protein
LPHTKPTSPDRDAQNRGRFVAAALLEAVGVSKLVDIKTCVERLHRDHEVDVLEPTRYLATKVDETITGLACKGCDY